jgi:hypothetical protein
MSYRCDICNEVRFGRELKRLSAIRKVRYNKYFKRFDRKEKKNVERYDSCTEGTEIVNEQRLCEKHYEELKDTEPRVIEPSKALSYIGEKKKEVKFGQNDLDLTGLKEKFEKRR